MNRSTKTVEIPPTENAMFIVKDGEVTKIEAPKTRYGEYRVIWKDGKVLDVIRSERMRI